MVILFAFPLIVSASAFYFSFFNGLKHTIFVQIFVPNDIEQS